MEFNNYLEVAVLAFVISSFSIIQTLFGVGLLVFGTPTLLLMGYPFTTALFLLLPSSILLSAIQIFVGKNQIEIKKEFIYYSIPPMLFGLFIISAGFFDLDLKLIIGFILVFITAVRTLKKYHKYLLKIFSHNVKLYMVFMGAIHGISNQGGGLLTHYFSTLLSNSLLFHRHKLHPQNFLNFVLILLHHYTRILLSILL